MINLETGNRLEMMMGIFSRPNEDAKKNGQQGNRPIVTTLCLMTDILTAGFSFGLLLLIALNMDGSDQMVGGGLAATEKLMKLLSNVMVLSIFATLVIWISSMFAGIFSITILFGKKYNWPCCPGLKSKITSELQVGPPNDDASEFSSDSGFYEL